MVLDGAHNPAGAAALVGALGEAFAWDRPWLVLAISANKDLDGIVAELARLQPNVLVAQHSNLQRAAPAHEVAEACRRHGLDDVEQFDSVPEALAAAGERAEQADLILVTGSLYTVADARRAIVTTTTDG